MTMATMTMTTMTMTMTTMTMTTMTMTMTMKAWYAIGRGRPDCEEGEGTLSSAITLAIAVTLYCRDLHVGEGGLEMPWCHKRILKRNQSNSWSCNSHWYSGNGNSDYDKSQSANPNQHRHHHCYPQSTSTSSSSLLTPINILQPALGIWSFQDQSHTLGPSFKGHPPPHHYHCNNHHYIYRQSCLLCIIYMPSPLLWCQNLGFTWFYETNIVFIKNLRFSVIISASTVLQFSREWGSIVARNCLPIPPLPYYSTNHPIPCTCPNTASHQEKSIKK